MRWVCVNVRGCVRRNVMTKKKRVKTKESWTDGDGRMEAETEKETRVEHDNQQKGVN